MKVKITSKGFTANEKQVALIEKKFQKLSKFFTDDIEAHVTMGYKRNRQTMEAMIPVKGVIFRAEYTDSDMNTCLDKVVEKLMTQVTRYKKKLIKTHRNKGIVFEEVPEVPEEELVGDAEVAPVKVKQFEMTTMDTDEAIMQMELLGHTFFIFLNEATGRAAVVYKRADGGYGLLDPQY